MSVVVVDKAVCAGCGDCVEACPSEILKMIAGKAEVTKSSDDCMDCEACVTVCSCGAATYL